MVWAEPGTVCSPRSRCGTLTRNVDSAEHLSQRPEHLLFAQPARARAGAWRATSLPGQLLIALFIGVAGPLLALVAAAALIAAVLILADTHWGFVALCGVVFLLPFASLPFSVGFKPTFLDLALGALFFVWFFKLVIGQQREFVASPLGILVALFMLMAVFSFALGLTHSPANTFLLRRFLEILFGVSLFFVTINTVRSEAEIDWVTRWIVLARLGLCADCRGLLCHAAGMDDRRFSTGWAVLTIPAAQVRCALSRTTPTASCVRSARRWTRTCSAG